MVRIAAAVGGALLMASSAMSQVPPAARSELAPTGTLRAGINYGNAILATKDSATGQSRGVAIELTHELARRLGVPVELVAYTSVATMVDGAKTGGWDIAFLGADPARAGEISFTAPYLELEATYLVPAGSPLRAIDDVDRDGVRVAAPARAAYELFLSRSLKHAQLVRAPSPEAAIDLLASGKVEALAGLTKGSWPPSRRCPGRGCSTGSSSRCSRRSVFPRAATPGCSTSVDSSRRPRPRGWWPGRSRRRAFAACRSLPRPPPPSAHARTRIAPPASTPREESLHAVRTVHDAAAPASSRFADGYARDVDQIVLADQLGFREAWVGEHLTERWENAPAPDLLIAQALALTRAREARHGRHAPRPPQPRVPGPPSRHARPHGAGPISMGDRRRRHPDRSVALRPRREESGRRARPLGGSAGGRARPLGVGRSVHLPREVLRHRDAGVRPREGPRLLHEALPAAPSAHRGGGQHARTPAPCAWPGNAGGSRCRARSCPGRTSATTGVWSRRAPRQRGRRRTGVSGASRATCSSRPPRPWPASGRAPSSDETTWSTSIPIASAPSR